MNILAWEIVTYEVQHNSPGQLSLNQNSSQSLGTSQGPQAHTARFNIYAIRMQTIYVAYVHLWTFWYERYFEVFGYILVPSAFMQFRRSIGDIWLHSSVFDPKMPVVEPGDLLFWFRLLSFWYYSYIYRCDYCNPLPVGPEGLQSWYVKPRRPSELIC